MTTLSLNGFSGRLRAIGRAGSKAGKRFRGKKATIESIHKKRQSIDCTMVRLLEEVAGARAHWVRIQVAGSTMEEDRLTSVIARAQLMHRTLAMAMANVEALSIFSLNACDIDMQTATSLLARLRLEVRASAARAAGADKETFLLTQPVRRLTA